MDSGEQTILICRDVYEADGVTVSERAECEIEVEVSLSNGFFEDARVDGRPFVLTPDEQGYAEEEWAEGYYRRQRRALRDWRELDDRGNEP
jgi:hypothetical protein